MGTAWPRETVDSGSTQDHSVQADTTIVMAYYLFKNKRRLKINSHSFDINYIKARTKLEYESLLCDADKVGMQFVNHFLSKC